MPSELCIPPLFGHIRWSGPWSREIQNATLPHYTCLFVEEESKVVFPLVYPWDMYTRKWLQAGRVCLRQYICVRRAQGTPRFLVERIELLAPPEYANGSAGREDGSPILPHLSDDTYIHPDLPFSSQEHPTSPSNSDPSPGPPTASLTGRLVAKSPILLPYPASHDPFFILILAISPPPQSGENGESSGDDGGHLECIRITHHLDVYPSLRLEEEYRLEHLEILPPSSGPPSRYPKWTSTGEFSLRRCISSAEAESSGISASPSGHTPSGSSPAKPHPGSRGISYRGVITGVHDHLLGLVEVDGRALLFLSALPSFPAPPCTLPPVGSTITAHHLQPFIVPPSPLPSLAHLRPGPSGHILLLVACAATTISIDRIAPMSSGAWEREERMMALPLWPRLGIEQRDQGVSVLDGWAIHILGMRLLQPSKGASPAGEARPNLLRMHEMMRLGTFTWLAEWLGWRVEEPGPGRWDGLREFFHHLPPRLASLSSFPDQPEGRDGECEPYECSRLNQGMHRILRRFEPVEAWMGRGEAGAVVEEAWTILRVWSEEDGRIKCECLIPHVRGEEEAGEAPTIQLIPTGGMAGRRKLLGALGGHGGVWAVRRGRWTRPAVGRSRWVLWVDWAVDALILEMASRDPPLLPGVVREDEYQGSMVLLLRRILLPKQDSPNREVILEGEWWRVPVGGGADTGGEEPSRAFIRLAGSGLQWLPGLSTGELYWVQHASARLHRLAQSEIWMMAFRSEMGLLPLTLAPFAGEMIEGGLLNRMWRRERRMGEERATRVWVSPSAFLTMPAEAVEEAMVEGRLGSWSVVERMGGERCLRLRIVSLDGVGEVDIDVGVGVSVEGLHIGARIRVTGVERRERGRTRVPYGLGRSHMSMELEARDPREKGRLRGEDTAVEMGLGEAGMGEDPMGDQLVRVTGDSLVVTFLLVNAECRRCFGWVPGVCECERGARPGRLSVSLTGYVMGGEGRVSVSVSSVEVLLGLLRGSERHAELWEACRGGHLTYVGPLGDWYPWEQRGGGVDAVVGNGTEGSELLREMVRAGEEVGLAGLEVMGLLLPAPQGGKVHPTVRRMGVGGPGGGAYVETVSRVDKSAPFVLGERTLHVLGSKRVSALSRAYPLLDKEL